jgi:cutinase
VQGVEYPAAIVTNLLPENASPQGISNLKSLLNEANQRCPESIVLVSGYSQGAAIVHAAFDGLSSSIKDQVAGIVLFGDTRNLQEHGRIAGYSPEKTLIICQPLDLVCAGTLIITPAHVTYPLRVPEAVDFMDARVLAALLNG